MRQFPTKDGRYVNIFRPKAEEAEKILSLMQRIGGETDFLLIDAGGIRISVEDERDFLDDMYESVDSALFAVSLDGEIVGSCSVNFHRNKRTNHVASIGISLLREGWGIGIGRAMMETMISHARRAGAHKLELEVRADNERAIALYEKMGFSICGRSRDHLCINGEYFDELTMELML